MSDGLVDIKKIAIVIGTRPEIIKMAPVIRECQVRGVDFFVIHSNQHYSADMDAIFFDQLELPAPGNNLNVGSGLHANQTGNILIKIEPILEQNRPDLVLVQGDTNTVMAAALAASKLGIKVGHVEAGLRSYDRTMPEETNRVLTDHMSDFLFSVGPNQTQILKDEGISEGQIFEVGNTISDALFQHLPMAQEKSSVLTDLNLEPRSYILLTAHRASNVDVEGHLRELIDLVTIVADRYQKQVVWPIHPRTRKKLDEYGLDLGPGVTLLDPLGYFDFIKLQANALLIMTDSGGIQEEACMLRVPCVTLRQNTERPETVEVGANVLVGRDQRLAIEAIDRWIEDERYDWANPFGDGTVAATILDVVLGTRETKQTTVVIDESKPTVAVIGQGYMGLPIAALIANAGHRVTGVDINPSVVDQINEGRCPFDEDGLPELISRVVNVGALKASTTVPSSDIYLVAVPTPHKDRRCDLTYVEAAIDSIVEVAVNGQLVIIESTISPKTTQQMQDRLAQIGLKIDVVHCPERAIPGNTLSELVNNDRIIGAFSEKAAKTAGALYQAFVKGDILYTDTTTSECVKLIENTSRDVQIAFANELAEIADELGINVLEAINLANRHPRVNILDPGPGVGGHCIPIDPWFLIQETNKGNLIKLAREKNDQRPLSLLKKVPLNFDKPDNNKIGLLGVAYKPGVGDTRETPAKKILDYFRDLGQTTAFHDPYVTFWECERISSPESLIDWADITILVTHHPEYSQLIDDSRVFSLTGLS